MKHTHYSKQTIATFKAFSQTVCRIKFTSVTDVEKHPETIPVSVLLFTDTKKAPWKRSKTFHIHSFQSECISRHVFLPPSSRWCYSISLQFQLNFNFNQQIRFTEPWRMIMIHLLWTDASSPKDSSFRWKGKIQVHMNCLGNWFSLERSLIH